MKDPVSQERFELLDAGRAMGNLSAEEEQEWKELSQAYSGEPGGEVVSFDDLVSVLELTMSPATVMPEGLTEQLRKGVEPFERAPAGVKTVRGPWRRSLAHPAFGWAVAACFALMLLMQKPGEPDRVAEVESDRGAVQMQFSGVGRFDTVGGSVKWSNSRQQGWMRLTGLAPNDPTENQYQLWIVDKARGGQYPVDGGVFDIPANATGEVLIMIDSKLEVNGPSVFVITLEQPGGVVVSDQTQVVAVAKSKEA